MSAVPPVHDEARFGVIRAVSLYKATTMRTALLAVSALLAFSGGAYADEGKDESGKGKSPRYESKDKDRREWKDKQDRRGSADDYFHRHGHIRIPDGHLPPPGECRIWYPDRPAGHQPPPFKCGQARPRVEPGGWYMQPGHRPQEFEVVVYDQQRPGVVVDIGIFDAKSGSMIRISGATR